MMNTGKRFETDIRNSVPKEVYFQRIYDQSFDHTSIMTRFTIKNPFDCMMYYNGTLFLLELKSTKSNLTFQTDKKEKGKMIKLHQIQSLTRASLYKGIIAGFLFNFRLNKNECYFMNVIDFNDVVNSINKKSLNNKDVKANSIIIPNRKLKVNYRYDIESLFNNLTSL